MTCKNIPSSPSGKIVNTTLSHLTDTLKDIPQPVCLIIAQYALSLQIEEFNGGNKEQMKALKKKIEKQWKGDLPRSSDKFIYFNKDRNLVLFVLDNLINKKKAYPDTTIATANIDHSLEGLMIYQTVDPNIPKSWHIYILISAPWNLQTPSPTGAKIGSALIQHIKKQAKNRPDVTAIQLRSEPGAEFFYLKVGFHLDKTTSRMFFNTQPQHHATK